MGRRNSRCCCSCDKYSDNFNRSNDTDLGASWDERAGDWEIASNALATSDSDALVVMTLPGLTSGRVTVTVAGTTTAGDKLRIIVDYVDDDNYHFAEFTLGASATTTGIALYKRNGGTDDLIDSRTWAAQSVTTAEVCFIDGWIQASTNPLPSDCNAFMTAAPTTLHGGDECGVGTGTVTGTVTVDNFALQRHNDSNSTCTACAYACVACDGGKATRQVQVTFAGVAGGGSCGAELNTDFVCDLVYGTCSAFLSYLCYWEWLGTLDICGTTYNYRIEVRWITASRLDVRITNTSIGPQDEAAFTTSTGDTDCLNWDEYDIPISGFATGICCDWTAATCKVTAL